MSVDDEVEFDPQAILAVLYRHNVEFIAIGGFAASLQGSPFPTDDVDITPNARPANLGRLSAALKDLDARVRAEGVPGGLPFDHDPDSLAAVRVWNLTTRYGNFDISFTPSGTTGFDDLAVDARDVELDGVRVRLASLADIVRSKEAANRPKDQRVLPLLREAVASESAQRRRKRRPPAT